MSSRSAVEFARMAKLAADRRDWPQALQLLQAALAEAPQAAPLHLNTGNVLKLLGRLDEARAAYENALHFKPGWPDALYNLGNLALAGQDLPSAAAYYRAALNVAPDHADAHYNLGCVYTSLAQLKLARQHLCEAIRLRPDHADAHHNLARTLRRDGLYAEARKEYELALAINPQHALAIYSLGTLDLLERNWQTGWQGYEARWAALGKPYPDTPLPRWNGEPVAENESLLVIGEQGLGDMIQFARFLPELGRRFAQVGVLVPEALVRLFQQNLPGHIAVFSKIESHKAYTWHIPYMSLAFALGIDETLLDGAPYLQAQAGAAWPAAHRRRIGLVWQGNPAQSDNALRSIPLASFAPVLRLPHLEWHSLQRGGNIPDTLEEHILDHTASFNDLADTAAYIQQLDLVVTVCTAVAHLAGALGVPTLLLSRFDADWRWQRERHDSPWYRSFTILRQRERDNWKGPLSELAALLQYR